jgi:hypothetical protein
MISALRLFSLALLVFVIGCNKGAQRKAGLLPGSTGGSLEVMVVMDDSLWNGSAGAFLRQKLASPMPGLPQSESWYRLVHIQSKNFNELLRRSHLLIVVEIDSVKNATRLNNYWSKPQLILSYKAQSNKELLSIMKIQIEEDEKALRAFENQHILKRLSRQTSPASKLLKNEKLKLTIPANLELDTDEDDISIYWSRNMKSDQCLMIYTRPYNTNSTMLGADILPVRDSICKAFIPGQFDESYMTTEYRMAPQIVPHELANAFCLETRGLWRVEGDFMGGPFLNYTVYDEKNERIITLEGFVYAPELDKRNLLFELECAMNSLEIVN